MDRMPTRCSGSGEVATRADLGPKLRGGQAEIPSATPLAAGCAVPPNVIFTAPGLPSTVTMSSNGGRFVAKIDKRVQFRVYPFTEAEIIMEIMCKFASFMSKECGTAEPEFVTSGDDGALPGVVRSDGHACEHFPQQHP